MSDGRGRRTTREDLDRAELVATVWFLLHGRAALPDGLDSDVLAAGCQLMVFAPRPWGETVVVADEFYARRMLAERGVTLDQARATLRDNGISVD